MVNLVSDTKLRLVAISNIGTPREHLTSDCLIAALHSIRDTHHDMYCVECRVVLPGEVEGDLTLIPAINSPCGIQCGWLVQLATDYDTCSFLLARHPPNQQDADREIEIVEVELFGCLDRIDSRCLISDQELVQWIECEFNPTKSSQPYRWIELRDLLQC